MERISGLWADHEEGTRLVPSCSTVVNKKALGTRYGFFCRSTTGFTQGTAKVHCTECDGSRASQSLGSNTSAALVRCSHAGASSEAEPLLPWSKKIRWTRTFFSMIIIIHSHGAWLPHSLGTKYRNPWITLSAPWLLPRKDS